MNAETQIHLFSQRRLRGKLHLPYLTAEVMDTLEASLDTIQARPICGRMLNNHRESRAQVQDRAEMAGSLEEFTYQLMSGKACRHCAVKAGILVRTVTTREIEGDEDGTDE